MSDLCKFHPVSPSPRCRVCKNIGQDEHKSNSESLLKKPENKHGPMTVWGDKNTWNISSLMRKNVLSSVYFNKELFNLRDLSEVLDQITQHVQSIEPWVKGTCNSPSSLFCILIKLFIMKLSEGMLRLMLDSPNPFIKVSGILYIRFLSNPSEYWERLKEQALCQDFIPNTSLTFSQLIIKILSEQDYFNLQLPRIPAPIQIEILQKVSEIPIRISQFNLNQQKTFEKDSILYILGNTLTPAVFKSKSGNFAHVQINGKDQHVHLSEIVEDFMSANLIPKNDSGKVFASNKTEYLKRSVSYKEALMFKIPEKRIRDHESPVVETKIKKNLEKVSIDKEISSKVDDLSEVFRLG